MQRDLPGWRVTTMLEQENALPRAKRHSPSLNWDRKLGLSKRASDVRRHVVRTLVIVAVERGAFGRESSEEVFEIATGSSGGIFLD